MTKKIALIAGASGQTGSFLLDLLLESENYSKVVSVSRSPLEKEHPKLEQKVVDMFAPGSLAIPCDDVFCCLGTTIKKAGSQEQFSKIDHDLVVKLATETLQAGAKGFYVMSSAGASADSSIFYVRVKGNMEADIAAAGFPHVGIFKPSMLLGPRKEYRLGELIGKATMQFFAPIIPAKWKGVQSQKVAESMIQVAQNPAEGVKMISNEEILNM